MPKQRVATISHDKVFSFDVRPSSKFLNGHSDLIALEIPHLSREVALLVPADDSSNQPPIWGGLS